MLEEPFFETVQMINVKLSVDQQVWKFCKTGIIGCFPKTQISALADPHTVHSGVIELGGGKQNKAYMF